MNKIALWSSALLICVGAAAPSYAAEEFGTPKEAETMVKRAVEHIRKVGNDQAFADFTAKKPPFVDRDLYVIVTDMNGTSLAHGLNPKMVGKNLMEIKDPDGTQWYRERVELARTKTSFWHEYKFTDPVSKKVGRKSTYCEREQDIIVCTGAYKR